MHLCCHKFVTASACSRTRWPHAGGKELVYVSTRCFRAGGTLPKLLHHAKPPHKMDSLLAAEIKEELCKKNSRFLR